jgi:TatD DNase family protein
LLVDTHCHLDFDSFSGDLDKVLDRARDAGLDRILNPAIDLDSSKTIVALAEAHREVYAAVGVHPNSALSWDGSSIKELKRLAGTPKVIAIGEIGLDYYRDRAPRDLQRVVFRNQLELAAEFELPVVIHTRNASPGDLQALQDALELLATWHADLVADQLELAAHPGVLHSYSGDIASVEEAVGMNFFIGITGPVTFKNAVELRELVSYLSLEHLLIETDAPFLTPHPHRGKRNEPAYVRFIAHKIAEIHGLSFDTVANITSVNAERLFRWQVTH